MGGGFMPRRTSTMIIIPTAKQDETNDARSRAAAPERALGTHTIVQTRRREDNEQCRTGADMTHDREFFKATRLCVSRAAPLPTRQRPPRKDEPRPNDRGPSLTAALAGAPRGNSVRDTLRIES